MARSSVWGRRVHISGSAGDIRFANAAEVNRAREIVVVLVKKLLARGATFVVPVDAEKLRADGVPICFDWLVWETIAANLASRPACAPGPLVVAVKHHKNEEQIPPQFAELWESMRASDLVHIESAAQWNMNSKRMEAQAQRGDILITLGGGEGVLFLANLYHESGRPVIPLNLNLCGPHEGTLKLVEFGLTGKNAERLFRTIGASDPHHWLNRIHVSTQKSVKSVADDCLALLETLQPPTAFVVRLLNVTHPDYTDVENFFDGVVKPVIEGEMGYAMKVVDGVQAYEHARIDQEIFVKLHKCKLVLADITGSRPNCFLELGYALGRSAPTVICAKSGTDHPFDLTTVAAHHWTTGGTLEERRQGFRKHLEAIERRPALVPDDPLIP